MNHRLTDNFRNNLTHLDKTNAVVIRIFTFSQAAVRRSVKQNDVKNA